jgi:hypothetical protein
VDGAGVGEARAANWFVENMVVRKQEGLEREIHCIGRKAGHEK